ncbi:MULTISPECIES: SelB C-terminal domain-containing protein [unclassified Knoellia]|uniref:SelB domain-containing protein n=1 Tax=Knoellia altitudinis TaxID=3404795 RepID=UPI00361D4CD9
MRWVLATAGHVDHGKSTLVQALTGRDPDRLGQEKVRGLTIELGFAWTSLPGAGDVAFVDVPGHQRFVGTMLAGLGPTPAVLFVVAADQGWQAQSEEHLAAVEALGICDGLLVLTRCDLTDARRRDEVAVEAAGRLARAGLRVPVVSVSARTGRGLDDLRRALVDLTARMPAPDPDAPVRLWTDRSFSVAGAGTVVTGTLGAGTVRSGDRLTLVDDGVAREVVVRGLHSQDQPCESVGPVSRVAVNLRRIEAGPLSRSAVLCAPGAFALSSVVDVQLTRVGSERARSRGAPPVEVALPDHAVLHVGSAAMRVDVRPLGERHARLRTHQMLPWWVGDSAILRDPANRAIWSVRVADVEPLPLRRRGSAARRGEELSRPLAPADLRLADRGGDHHVQLVARGLPDPIGGVRVGDWWFHPATLSGWVERLRALVGAHHDAHPLSPGLTGVAVLHGLHLPAHLRAASDGGDLPPGLAPPGADLVRYLARSAGLPVTQGRVHDPRAGGLGKAESAVAAVEAALLTAPFAAPERDELAALGLGSVELAAAQRTGRLLRLADDVVLLPAAPALAMRALASLEQPFTLSAARQALGTTRRVAVPLLEHLDARGWTRRVDGRLRRVVH